MPKGVYERTEEHRRKISESHKGKKFSEERRRKHKEAHNKPEVRKKNSEAGIKRWQNPEYREKQLEALNKPETKRKLSEAANKRWEDPEYRKKVSESNKGDNNPAKRPEVKKKLSESHKALWEEDPNFVSKMIQAWNITPNKPEQRIERLLDIITPLWYKINVKGEVMTLGGKIPDYVNVNGEKKVIEYNGCYPHDCPIHYPNGGRHKGVNGLKEARKRIKLFKSLGYDTLVIWEHDMDDVMVVANKILKFHGLPLMKGQYLQTRLRGR